MEGENELPRLPGVSGQNRSGAIARLRSAPSARAIRIAGRAPTCRASRLRKLSAIPSTATTANALINLRNWARGNTQCLRDQDIEKEIIPARVERTAETGCIRPARPRRPKPTCPAFPSLCHTFGCRCPEAPRPTPCPPAQSLCRSPP